MYEGFETEESNTEAHEKPPPTEDASEADAAKVDKQAGEEQETDSHVAAILSEKEGANLTMRQAIVKASENGKHIDLHKRYCKNDTDFQVCADACA